MISRYRTTFQQSTDINVEITLCVESGVPDNKKKKNVVFPNANEGQRES